MPKTIKFNKARLEIIMLTYDLTKTDNKALYIILYELIRDDILSGKIAGDEKLPSKRALSEHLGVSKITVENAYSLLLSEGYIYSVEKRGYYAEADLVKPSSINNESGGLNSFDESEDITARQTINFSSNTIPAELFPFSVWSALIRKTISDNKEKLLLPVPFNGAYYLRKAVSDYLAAERGVNVSPGRIIIGAGSEYLYSLLVKLIGKDTAVAIEDPSYPKTAFMYEYFGADTVRCPLDNNGISISGLMASGVRAVHLSPSHNFPTGIITSPKRMAELSRWLSEDDNRYIIEDDFDSELRFTGRPVLPFISSDTTGRVIYINSFSKTIAPSVRMSYMVIPETMVDLTKKISGYSSCTVPSFEQYTLAEFISQGYFSRHLSRARRYYKNLRKSLFDIYYSDPLSLKSEIIEGGAGLHFFLKLNTEVSESDIKQMLLDDGIKVSFLSDYSVFNKNDKMLLINYSGIKKEEFVVLLNKLDKIL